MQHVQLLKAAKSYIKGDFKVTLFVNATLALRRDANSSVLNTTKSFSPIRKWETNYCNRLTSCIWTYINILASFFLLFTLSHDTIDTIDLKKID